MDPVGIFWNFFCLNNLFFNSTQSLFSNSGHQGALGRSKTFQSCFLTITAKASGKIFWPKGKNCHILPQLSNGVEFGLVHYFWKNITYGGVCWKWNFDYITNHFWQLLFKRIFSSDPLKGGCNSNPSKWKPFIASWAQ